MNIFSWFFKKKIDKTAFSCYPDAVLVISQSGEILYANDKLFDVLSKIVSDSVYRKTIADNCASQYEVDFSPQRQADCLDHILSHVN